METPLWQPTITNIKASNLYQFIQFVNDKEQLSLTDYASLYQWSIQYPKQFWPSIWDFCHVKASKKWNNVLINENKMSGAKWFEGATLNFAENLLRFRDDKLAIIYRDETGKRITFTYKALYQAVISFTEALRNYGVIKNDRVVGFLPNIPETVVAMLATTALGAIWSSCSPDFGAEAAIERFAQIKPKIIFAVNKYSYNGKTFDVTNKVKLIKKNIPTLNSIFPTLDPKNIVPHSKSRDLNPKQLPFDHPLYIMYSSGTTGIPKCIVHGAGGTLLQHLKEHILHGNLTRNDTIFFFTTCGWMMWNWLISSLAVGATIVLYDGSPMYPKSDAMFKMIDEERITIFGTSAKFLSTIEKINCKPIYSHKLSTLHSVLTTGSTLMPSQFDFVYKNIKKNLRLSSISGGTDIISCFALGNPILPVYRGELQSIGLGLKVKVFNEKGLSVKQERGELVCTAPFPSMPIYFWNDPKGEKYHKAYFEKFPNVWTHGDYAAITAHNGVIIYGRSDATLNPGGIRIGTAEIYQQVEKFNQILESIAVAQDFKNDTRIILFVKMRENETLTQKLIDKIKSTLRNNISPHHVPAKIIQVPDIPRTINGKLVELAVQNTINNKPVKNIGSLANPEALEYFKKI